ncbi:hypothetical protein [Caulobacter sp.]
MRKTMIVLMERPFAA